MCYVGSDRMEVPIPEEHEVDFISLIRVVISHLNLDLLTIGQREVVSALLTFAENCDIPESEKITEECDIDI